MCQKSKKMNFRDFITEQEASQNQVQPQQTIDWTPPQSNPAATQASQTTDYAPTQQQGHALSPLVQAMKQLDPFIRQPGITHFSGTVDFASPEQARGQGKESDDITNLYATFKSTRPQLASMVQPVAAAFKQFERDFIELCYILQVPMEWTENEYLANKVDRWTITKIQNGIQAFSTAMQQVPMDAIMTAQQTWRKMQQSFQQFATSFQSIQQQLLQAIPALQSQW